MEGFHKYSAGMNENILTLKFNPGKFREARNEERILTLFRERKYRFTNRKSGTEIAFNFKRAVLEWKKVSDAFKLLRRNYF